MTKKQLLDAIKDYPEDTLIFLDERATMTKYGLLNHVRGDGVYITNDPAPDAEILMQIKAIILSEK